MSTQGDVVYDAWVVRWRRPPAVADLVLVHGGADMGPGYHDTLHAFETRRGLQRWSIGGRQAPFDLLSQPAVVGDVAVVGRTGGHLIAVGLADGGERWRRRLDVRVPLPHATGARVALVDGAGWLLLVDAVTGRVERPLQVAAGPATVLTVNGRLLSAEPGGGVRVFEPGGTAPRWGLEGVELLGVDPAHDGVIVVEGATLVYLSAADGARRWTAPGPERPEPARVAIDGDRLIVADTDAVIALRAADGSEAWSVDLPEISSIAADRGLVAADAQAGVHVLRAADGSVAWSVALPRERHGALALTPGGLVMSPRTDGHARLACLCSGGRTLPVWIAEIGASGLT